MIDYTSKCVGCIHFELAGNDGSHGKRWGKCKKLIRDLPANPYNLNFCMAGCKYHEFASFRFCECGVYKEFEWSFCPLCGRFLKQEGSE